MSDQYQGSEQHKENYREFRKVQKKGFDKFVEERRCNYLNEYSKKPSFCGFCNKQLEYKDRKKKYCNSSCAAKFNNVLRKGEKRVFSDLAIENIRTARKKQSEQYKKENGDRNKIKGNRLKTNIQFINCKVCGKLFSCKQKYLKKTCSSECRTIIIFSDRKYQNKKKNYQKYFNKWVKKDVLLESSWEKITAEKLDELNIKWERPKFIRWKDSNNKERLYFPDFYLNDYDIYLDPKNPYCMKQDEEKMKIVAKEINIEYGNIEKIINFIKKIK